MVAHKDGAVLANRQFLGGIGGQRIQADMAKSFLKLADAVFGAENTALIAGGRAQAYLEGITGAFSAVAGEADVGMSAHNLGKVTAP